MRRSYQRQGTPLDVELTNSFVPCLGNRAGTGTCGPGVEAAGWAAVGLRDCRIRVGGETWVDVGPWRGESSVSCCLPSFAAMPTSMTIRAPRTSFEEAATARYDYALRTRRLRCRPGSPIDPLACERRPAVVPRSCPGS